MWAKYGRASPSCEGSRYKRCPVHARQRQSAASEKHRAIPPDRRTSKNRAASMICMDETCGVASAERLTVRDSQFQWKRRTNAAQRSGGCLPRRSVAKGGGGRRNLKTTTGKAIVP